MERGYENKRICIIYGDKQRLGGRVAERRDFTIFHIHLEEPSNKFGYLLTIK